jgi:hypothetical protein
MAELAQFGPFSIRKLQPPPRLALQNAIFGCVCRKLDSAIVVMKAAENRSGCDCADAANNSMNGNIQVLSPMDPRAIIVCGVLVKDRGQVSFSGHNQMVDAFPVSFPNVWPAPNLQVNFCELVSTSLL